MGRRTGVDNAYRHGKGLQTNRRTLDTSAVPGWGQSHTRTSEAAYGITKSVPVGSMLTWNYEERILIGST
jgi:hypothetical protein